MSPTPEPAGYAAYLHALEASVQPARFPLLASSCTIGRDPSCQVVVQQRREVSRRHARIERDSQGYTLADLGSANGTFVNARRINGPMLLHHNDLIGLGSSSSLLRFDDPDSTVVAAPGLRFDDRSRIFFLRNQPLDLSPSLAQLLLHLYRNAGIVCDRESCAQALWKHSYSAERDAAALDQAITTLRGKLGQSDPKAGPIHTRRGIGYLLEP
jgi:DNA-binding response OmpR family regulator